MIGMYQINKWAFQWKMSLNPDPSKQAPKFFFSRKTKKISHPSLCFENSIILETHIKNTLANSCCLINIWGTFESNYYQGKQSYRTVSKVPKISAETGVNNYVQSFSETTFRLWRHDLWWSLQQNISPETWVYSIQCLSSPIRSY